MGWLRVLWVVTDAAGVRCRSFYRLTRAMTGPPGSATTDAIVVPGHRSRRAPRIAPGGRPTPRFELNLPPEGVSEKLETIQERPLQIESRLPC
jgi:hypothetical protein